VDQVLSHMEGRVSRNGVASLFVYYSAYRVRRATGTGAYNLLTRRINLNGTVSIAADASEATSGFESFLLRPFNGLFRRDKAKGTTLRASIRGHYPRHSIRSDYANKPSSPVRLKLEMVLGDDGSDPHRRFSSVANRWSQRQIRSMAIPTESSMRL
jgi:hypothetical protein